MVDIFDGLEIFFLVSFSLFALIILSLVFGILSIFKWDNKILRWICPILAVPACAYLIHFALSRRWSQMSNQSDAEFILFELLRLALCIFFAGVAEFAVRVRKKKKSPEN